MSLSPSRFWLRVCLGLLAVKSYLVYDYLFSNYGLLKYKANLKELARLKIVQQALIDEQEELECKISYARAQLKNIDYLQALALEEFNYIPEGWKIIELDVASYDFAKKPLPLQSS